MLLQKARCAVSSKTHSNSLAADIVIPQGWVMLKATRNPSEDASLHMLLLQMHLHNCQTSLS